LNTGLHPLGNMWAPVEVVGSAEQNTQPVVIHQINHDYPKAFGISLLQGNLFTETEINGKQQLAIVNQSFVRSRLDGREPLGRVVRIPRMKQAPFSIGDDSFQIIGVVKDTLNCGITDQVMPEIYLPFTLLGRADRLAILTHGEPAAMIRAVLG